MSDMKCPFCGKEMLCGGTLCRYNPDCPIYDKPVPTEVLELLYRTRKALDVAVDGLTTIGGYLDYNDCVGIALDTKDEIYKILEQKD